MIGSNRQQLSKPMGVGKARHSERTPKQKVKASVALAARGGGLQQVSKADLAGNTSEVESENSAAKILILLHGCGCVFVCTIFANAKVGVFKNMFFERMIPG